MTNRENIKANYRRLVYSKGFPLSNKELTGQGYWYRDHQPNSPMGKMFAKFSYNPEAVRAYLRAEFPEIHAEANKLLGGGSGMAKQTINKATAAVTSFPPLVKYGLIAAGAWLLFNK